MSSCSSTLSQTLLTNSFGKVFFFSNFGHVTVFAKRKFIYWSPFWKRNFFQCFVLFCLFVWLFFWFMVVLRVYRYGASFEPKFLRESMKVEKETRIVHQNIKNIIMNITDWQGFFHMKLLGWVGCLCRPNVHMFLNVLVYDACFFLHFQIWLRNAGKHQ